MNYLYIFYQNVFDQMNKEVLRYLVPRVSFLRKWEGKGGGGGGGGRGARNYPVGLPGIPDRKLKEVKTSQ